MSETVVFAYNRTFTVIIIHNIDNDSEIILSYKGDLFRKNISPEIARLINKTTLVDISPKKRSINIHFLGVKLPLEWECSKKEAVQISYPKIERDCYNYFYEEIKSEDPRSRAILYGIITSCDYNIEILSFDTWMCHTNTVVHWGDYANYVWGLISENDDITNKINYINTSLKGRLMKDVDYLWSPAQPDE